MRVFPASPVRVSAVPALFALLFVAHPGGAAAAHIGVFADSQATRACATLTHGGQTTLYVVATLDGPLARGVRGAEFRVEIAQPSGWFLSYTPPKAAIYVGNPIDRDGDACKGAGVTLAFPACRGADVAANKVLLGTLLVTNVGGQPTQLVVKRHISPGNPHFVCPLLVECNEPRYDAHCVEPALHEACDGEAALASGPPGRDGAFFVTALNQPLDARPYAAPQRHPERELILGVATTALRFPVDGSTTALEAADIPSSELRRALAAARVAEIGAAFPDCVASPCASTVDARWCESVREIALLRFNHARTASRAVRPLRRVDGIRFVLPAASFVVPRETRFNLGTDVQEGMRISNETRFLVTISKPARLHVELLDGSGRAAATLQNAFVPAGEHEISLAEVEAASGLYTLRVRAGGVEATYKVVLSGA